MSRKVRRTISPQDHQDMVQEDGVLDRGSAASSGSGVLPSAAQPPSSQAECLTTEELIEYYERGAPTISKAEARKYKIRDWARCQMNAFKRYQWGLKNMKKDIFNDSSSSESESSASESESDSD